MSSAAPLVDDQLDVVQHPTLGTLKFPKSMAYEERNASIERLKASQAPKEKEAPVTSDLPETTQALGEQYLSPEAQAEADKKLAPASGALTSALLTGPFAGEAIEAGGLVPGALKVGRGLIGAGVGSGLGERSGSSVGGLFGETGKTVGGAIGAIGGGLLGGNLAAGLERAPATGLQSMRGQVGRVKSLPFGIQRLIPESMVPEGEIGSPTNPGPFSEVPSKMPSPSKGIGPTTFTVNRPEITEVGIPRATAPMPSREIQFVKSFERPEAPRIVEPGSPAPDVKVTYQSVPQPDLKRLVMTGDKDAILEWRRRGLQLPENVGFMIEGSAENRPWRNYRK